MKPDALHARMTGDSSPVATFQAGQAIVQNGVAKAVIDRAAEWGV